jgi:hypothetical protein
MAEGSSMASAANDTTSKVDLYYSTANQWREELAILRSIVLDCRLTEEFKWAKPCYTYEGSNVEGILRAAVYKGRPNKRSQQHSNSARREHTIRPSNAVHQRWPNIRDEIHYQKVCSRGD